MKSKVLNMAYKTLLSPSASFILPHATLILHLHAQLIVVLSVPALHCIFSFFKTFHKLYLLAAGLISHSSYMLQHFLRENSGPKGRSHNPTALVCQLQTLRGHEPYLAYPHFYSHLLDLSALSRPPKTQFSLYCEKMLLHHSFLISNSILGKCFPHLTSYKPGGQ
jgi:hypothetical protein